MGNKRDEVLAFFPPSLRAVLAPLTVWDEIEEIRLKAERPLLLRLLRGDSFVSAQGLLTKQEDHAYRVSAAEIAKVLNLACGASLYAFADEMRNGFLTLEGGHRLGLTGRAVVEGGSVRTLRHIAGLNFRVAREVRGSADPLLPFVLAERPPRVLHTLIVSPPRCGKTTVLRDLIRQISDGVPALSFPGVTVALVDERSEVAACHRGVPQFDVGVRTDVLDACPKAEGIRLLIRAFGPEVVAADEIGRAADARAIEDALNAGVKVVATAHAASLEELRRRPFFRHLFALGVVERFIFLRRGAKPGEVSAVLDGAGQPAPAVNVVRPAATASAPGKHGYR
uniref:Stage III sporulation protein AA n=1 Tax=Ammonifex degensii TaxID=42838 RepID=A0A7C1IXJ2_9THEO